MAAQPKKTKDEQAAERCGMTVEQWQLVKQQTAAAQGRGRARQERPVPRRSSRAGVRSTTRCSSSRRPSRSSNAPELPPPSTAPTDHKGHTP